jgi:hypothetical protein
MLIDGVVFGFCLGVNGDEEIQYADVEVIDNIEVAEQVPVGYVVNLSASQVWLVRQTLKALGLFPKIGSSPEEHLRNILNQRDLTILIEDSQDNPPQPLEIIEKAKIGRHTWAFQPRTVSSRDVTFRAIRARDVSEV